MLISLGLFQLGFLGQVKHNFIILISDEQGKHSEKPSSLGDLPLKVRIRVVSADSMRSSQIISQQCKQIQAALGHQSLSKPVELRNIIRLL